MSRSHSDLLPDNFLADWWSGARDTSPLAQIRARADYVNSLQEHLKDAASEEVQTELKALVEQCRRVADDPYRSR